MGLCESCLYRGHRALGSEDYPQGYPAPRPPNCRRQYVYQPDMYRRIDRSSTKVLPEKYLSGTLKDLADHVTRRATTDIERARALFAFLTTVDLTKLEKSSEESNSSNSPEGSSLEKILLFNRGQISIAQLYAHMSILVGVPCVVIKGISKNSNYNIGGTIVREKLASQWNAVLLDGQWRFVDVCWGSQCVVGQRSNQWAIASVDGERIEGKEYTNSGKTYSIQNDFYFLTDPDALVCTHLPNDAAWQLLPTAITEKQFASYVYIREHFFNLGLFMNERSHQDGILQSKDGEIRIVFGVNEASADDLEFSYLLFKSGGEKTANSFLERTVLFQKTASAVEYIVWFPVAGTFRLDIFGRGKEKHNHRFDIICSYILHCDQPKPGFEMLPDNPEIGWGFGEMAKKFGIRFPSHTDPQINTPNGRVQLSFKLSKPLTFGVALKDNKHSRWELQDYLIVRSTDDELVIDTRLPKEGQYALEVFAADPEQEGELSNVMNYLIRYPSQQQEHAPFQRIEDGILGARPFLAGQLGISPLSHPGDTITLCDGKEKIVFGIKNPTSKELFAELTHSVLDAATLQRQVSKGPEVGVIELTLSEPGLYGLNVFCRNSNFPERLHHIHSYLVRNMVGDIAIHSEDVTSSTRPPCMGSPHQVINTLITMDQEVEVYHPPTDKPVHLVFSRINVKEPPLTNVVQSRRLAGGETLITAQMKKHGDYKLDVYEERDGGLVLASSHRLTRRAHTAEELVKLKKVVSKWATIQGCHKVQGHKGDVFVRAQLKIGLALSKPEMLRAAIERFEERRLVDDRGELVRAKRLMLKLDAGSALKKAMREGKIGALESAIKMAEDKSLGPDLRFKILAARRQLIGKMGDKIRKMDQTTFAEVKSYQAPPKQVFEVMQGAFLLLGVDGKDTQTWDNLRVMMGDAARMKDKVKNIKPENINDVTAEQVSAILSPLKQDDVGRLSQTADSFYSWALQMIKLKVDQKNLRQNMTEDKPDDEIDLSSQ